MNRYSVPIQRIRHHAENVAEATQPHGPLYDLLRAEADDAGVSLLALTVLDVKRDPYRLGRPDHHAAAQWFADRLAEEGISPANPLHLRGIHYRLIGTHKPDGTIYVNDHATWEWMLNRVSWWARWLGHVPFEAITDERNEPPVKADPEDNEGGPFEAAAKLIGVPEIEPFDPDEFRAFPDATFPRPRHAAKLVVYGEKSSLGRILQAICDRCHADLYLPAGEISATQLAEMARMPSPTSASWSASCSQTAIRAAPKCRSRLPTSSGRCAISTSRPSISAS